MAGRKLIVVERYDRLSTQTETWNGFTRRTSVRRPGLRPDDKYQEDGGPSLGGSPTSSQAVTVRGSLERLLQAVTLNTLVGNGDAHAKNFSLLHERSGVLRLAPLYDVMCTLTYNDDHLAMYVDERPAASNRVTAQRIANEAVRWGLSRERAMATIGDLLDQAPRSDGCRSRRDRRASPTSWSRRSGSGSCSCGPFPELSRPRSLTRKATRTWARYSSRFSPRIPVETMSTARTFRSVPCACASACFAASSVTSSSCRPAR